MLTKDAKLRLVHAVTDQGVANEIEARLISTTPANPSASEAILAGIKPAADAALEERLIVALAGDDRGAAGKEIAQKLKAMVKVLQAHADGDEVGAVAASFTGQVAGMTTDVTIVADVAGNNGNLITLTFDGVDDIDTVLAAWNLANPGNEATLTGDGTQVPDLGEEIVLAGGADASDANLAPAKAAMGSQSMSAKTFESLVSALASREAAEEFRSKFDAMIAAVQAI